MASADLVMNYLVLGKTEVRGAQQAEGQLNRASQAADKTREKYEYLRQATSRQILTMSDDEFNNFYQYYNTELPRGIRRSTAELRFLSRGLQGFRMDMLNILFVGMQLSATFGGMVFSTAVGTAIKDVFGSLSELTVGQGSLLPMILDSLVGFTETMAEHPELAGILGDVAVSLAMLGSILVPLATLTMATGSIFGSEGLVATLKNMKNFLFGAGSAGEAAAATTGVLGGINRIAKLATKGAVIGIALEPAMDLAKGELELSGFLELFGIASIVTGGLVKNQKFKTLKTTGGYGLLLGLGLSVAESLVDSQGNDITFISALTNAIGASYAAKIAFEGTKVAKYSNAIGVATLMIQIAFDWPDVQSKGAEMLNDFRNMWKDFFNNTMVGSYIKAAFDPNIDINWGEGGTTLPGRGSINSETNINSGNSTVTNIFNNSGGGGYISGNNYID